VELNGPDLARSVRMVEIFAGTPFSEAVRHARRAGMISAFEETGVAPTVESRIA
jgi:hypothetical protein